MTEQPSITMTPSDPNLVTITAVHRNVAQQIIVVTEDKVRLCLSSHVEKMGARDGWHAPLGLVSALVASLVTTDFKPQALGLDAATWRALFLLGTFASAIWLVREFVTAYWAKGHDVEQVVQELKKGSLE